MKFSKLSYYPLIALCTAGCAVWWGPSITPGVRLASAGDHDGALAYYHSLIEAGNATGIVYRHAYEAAFRLEKFGEAEEYYAAALSAGIVPDSLRALGVSLWYDRAKSAMAREHWKTAATTAAALERLAPEAKEARFCARMVEGKTLYDRGSNRQLWDAVAAFGLAANADPASGLPHLWMARARYKNDRSNYDTALAEYEKALEKEPAGDFAGAAREEAEKIRARQKKMRAFWGN